MAPPKGGTGSAVATRGQSSEFVTHSTLQDELNKFRSELTSSLNENTNKTVNHSVDVLQASIVAKVSQVEEDVKSLSLDFHEHTKLSADSLEKLSERIDFLETSALFSAIHQNEKDQRARIKSFRLHGKKSLSKNSKDSMLEIYDFIIKPSFSRAVELGELSAVPTLESCGAYAHPLKSSNDNLPPALLFKFQTRYQIETFMKHARTVCSTLNDARPKDDPPLRVGPDLTSINRRVMTNLYDTPDVDKVRLGSHGVQFTLKSSPTSWLQVYNPFGSCIFEYQKKVQNPVTAKWDK